MKNFLVGLFKDIIDQAWTLLGMAVAWLVLEGSAKELTGNLILITLGVWVVTFPLRYEKPEEEEEPAPKKKPALRKKVEKK
jgi:putative Mn2+ efflux pump MntP